MVLILDQRKGLAGKRLDMLKGDGTRSFTVFFVWGGGGGV